MGGRGAGRGRGHRGRGRAREPQDFGGPHPRQAGPAGPPHGQPGPGAGGPPGGRGQTYAQMGEGAAAAAWGPPVNVAARATHRQPAQSEVLERRMGQMNLGQPQSAATGQRPPAGGSGGDGNYSSAAGPVGRGALRGSRRIEQGPVLVTRPATCNSKQGTVGHPVGLMANYFALNKLPNWALRRYRVDIAPDEDRTSERVQLLRVHREQLGGYLFDGTVLFTINALTSPQKPTLTLTSHNRDKTQIFTITIKEAGQVEQFDYAYIQVFNVLLRSCISALDLKLVGRDYYDAKAKVPVPQFRLELWPGYKTSIRQHEKDVLMCVEITHKVMRMQTALDILSDCIQRDNYNYKASFMKEVIGCIVLTKYNNKTYRIDDVDWDTHPSGTFKFRDEEITYAQYMQRKYEIKIVDMKQPMLVSRAKARDVRAGLAEIINLLPEVCHLTGLTDAMRSNFQLMKALAVHTRVSPASRIEKLSDFNHSLQQSDLANAQLKRFGMSLDINLVKFTGRVQSPVKILFGNKKEVEGGPNVDWTRELRNSHVFFAKELVNWVVLTPAKWRRDTVCFIEMLKKNAFGMRLKMGDPQIVDVQADNAGAYAQMLTQVLDRSQPDLIMCAVPNNRGDRYSAIKKKCCVDRAVPTQVVLTKNLNDPKKSHAVAMKVAVQINCKIGGAPWGLKAPAGGVMVVGFDVCHDTSNKSLSFGAMVASLDRPMTRYFSAVTPHRDGEELSKDLPLNIVKALRKYSEVNGQLPTRIFIYRDGVGEGQIPAVKTTEVEPIKVKLREVYKEVEPKMTFIIVTKRINTRLFTEMGSNPAPGTVVDDIVTDPEKYDFFLVSQSVREGTVSPTSYNVIEDQVALSADKLQQFTYMLCHMYFNWSGTVRVPAPCQYAHKLAFLVGQALHREPHVNLENTLYFL